jgi:hypothetical protein
MAEYMSLGPVDPNTAMWLRDASIEGKLPTIDQLTNDPRVFPYRFGHALLAYIGERWGDEAIGAILQTSRTAGIEGAFRRVLGLTLTQLSDQWRDAVLKKYLPEIGTRPKAAPSRRRCSRRSARRARCTWPLPCRPTGPRSPTSARRTSSSSICTWRTWRAARSSAGCSSPPTAATTRPSASSTRRPVGRPTAASSRPPASAARATRSSSST